MIEASYMWARRPWREYEHDDTWSSVNMGIGKYIEISAVGLLIKYLEYWELTTGPKASCPLACFSSMRVER